MLKELENGRLPDDLGSHRIDGIVYLSAAGTHRATLATLAADLLRLLPRDEAETLRAVLASSHAPDIKMRAMLRAFAKRRVVVLLDNLEDIVDPETRALTDDELDSALRTSLEAPHHCIKLVLTTRVPPYELALLEPGRQMRLDLERGLESPHAENVLRALDPGDQGGSRVCERRAAGPCS